MCSPTAILTKASTGKTLYFFLVSRFYSTGETGIKRHGKGKWVSKSVSYDFITKEVNLFPQGYEYDGEWEEDVIQGSGTMHLPDGSKYSGIFEAGKYQGKGKLAI